MPILKVTYLVEADKLDPELFAKLHRGEISDLQIGQFKYTPRKDVANAEPTPRTKFEDCIVSFLESQPEKTAKLKDLTAAAEGAGYKRFSVGTLIGRMVLTGKLHRLYPGMYKLGPPKDTYLKVATEDDAARRLNDICPGDTIK